MLAYVKYCLSTMLASLSEVQYINNVGLSKVRILTMLAYVKYCVLTMLASLSEVLYINNVIA